MSATLSGDRLYAEVIADGMHVHATALDVLVRSKGVDRSLLITDSMRPAGLADGAYRQGGRPLPCRPAWRTS